MLLSKPNFSRVPTIFCQSILARLVVDGHYVKILVLQVYRGLSKFSACHVGDTLQSQLNPNYEGKSQIVTFFRGKARETRLERAPQRLERPPYPHSSREENFLPFETFKTLISIWESSKASRINLQLFLALSFMVQHYRSF